MWGVVDNLGEGDKNNPSFHHILIAYKMVFHFFNLDASIWHSTSLNNF